MPELHGIVLHGAVFDESHRIVETLTREEGKLGCIARGARASKKRFAGGLDIFSTLVMIVEPGRSLWRLDSCQVVAARLGIRAGLDRFERASRLTECARLLTNAHQTALEQYDALEFGLDACDRGDITSAIAGYAGLLEAAGIMPDLSVCADCGDPDPARASLSTRSFGIVCTRCGTGMRSYPRKSLRALATGRAEDSASADDAEDAALHWVEAHVGHTLKTRVTQIDHQR
ncbi:MAG: DNA repair protein RecO [Clostridia bacterium]|nr:DNA repair protein RecO [Deltaproteobacteria bacterium]